MDRRIILVQHCQAEHHTNGMVGSWTDTELTELGRKQAACVAGQIPGLIDESENWILISSDLKRCTQTAASIQERIAKELRLEPDLREINLGEAVGKSQVWARKNELTKPSMPPSVDWQPFHGVETWRRFYERICTTMNLLTAEIGDPMIVVTHGGTCTAVFAWWLRLPVEHMTANAFGIKGGGISVLSVNDWGQHILERLSVTEHLSGLT